MPREYESLSDGEELNDISIYDFIPQTVSAFAQLLMEKENMKAWNDIINCTEDQQNELLDNLEKEHKLQNEAIDHNQSDNRRIQPGFSPDQCFKRIDADLKNMLKKKHIPLVSFKSIFIYIFFSNHTILREFWLLLKKRSLTSSTISRLKHTSRAFPLVINDYYFTPALNIWT